MKRRILSVITALALCLGLCPVGAFAADVPADAVARVEKEGVEAAYVTDLAEAFTSGSGGATVTLLADVVLSKKVFVPVGGIFTLDLNGHRIDGGTLANPIVVAGALTIRGSGTVRSDSGVTVKAMGDGAALTLEGGSFSSSADGSVGVSAVGRTLRVTSDSVTIGSLYVGTRDTVLTAGTYTGSPAIEKGISSITWADLLGENCAFYRGNQPLALADLTGDTLEGTVTVKACTHPNVQFTTDASGSTHSRTCPYCGKSETEDCTYGSTYGHDAANHWQACTVCGGRKTKPHTSGLTTTAAGNTVTLREGCTVCGYGADVGRVTFAFPKLTYGQTEGDLTWTTTVPDGYKMSLCVDNGASHTMSGSSTNLRELYSVGDTVLKMSAGEHTLKVDFFPYPIDVSNPISSNASNLTFTVAPRPVNISRVIATNRPYDGTNQVEITTVTLDSKITDDAVSVDCTNLTGTVSSANAGTYETVTLPTLMLTGADAANYALTQPSGAVKLSTPVEISKAQWTGLSFVFNLQAGTSGSLDLTNLIPARAALGEPTTESDVFDGEPALSGKTLSYKLTAEASGRGAIKVPVASMTNYKDYELFILIDVTDKPVPVLTVSDITHIYDGKAVTAADIQGKATVDGKEVEGEWSFDPLEALTEVADSGVKRVTFTPTDHETYAEAYTYITVTIREKAPDPVKPSTPSTGGGSTGGSSGSSGSTLSGASTLPVTTTGQNSSATTTTASPAATVSGGRATASVDAAMGDEIVKQAVANNSKNVVIAPSVTGSVTAAEVRIPAATVGQLGSQTNASLTVSTPVADVTIPNGGLGSLSSPGGTITVAAEKSGSRVELTVTANGRTVDYVPGGLTLTVPVSTYASPGTVAVLVGADGSREVVRKSVADNGRLTVPLEGSATLEIVDNSKQFADVPAGNWAADAVAFVSAHELFDGTGNSRFSPSEPMSRGMLAVVLHNLENNPTQAVSSVFADVGYSAWYAEGVAWAAAAGIVNGYGGGQFGPGDSISREQLAVMLWRYAGSPASGGRLGFTDAGQASGWALEALRWAVENGILSGYGDGRLNPRGSATRAETAQMLRNYLVSQAA